MSPHTQQTLRSFPALDSELSPFTGWTREHHAALADSMLLGVRQWASPHHGRITPPGREGGYGRAIDGLEGFARTFMTAGFRLAGEHGRDPLNLAEWYAEGLRSGSDPQSPERWIRPDEHGQAKVEAAALALVLDMTRSWIWDRLDATVQEQVVDWFSRTTDADYPPINWVWFRIVVQQFLKSVGADYSQANIDEDLALHDTFERDGGWYSDGDKRSYDHYCGWALHLYPVLWQRMAGHDDGPGPARKERDTAHLNRFLLDAVRLVGADGSPLIQGRSLIYRFAAAAPFWGGALAGCTAVDPGLLRRAASGIVRHFADRGAPDADGLLTLGWHHEWRQMAQSYSGPGSPYWASKGLLGLALPADHEVWTAVEKPLPVEEDDFTFTAAAPGWLASGTRADGVVRVINHGTDHASPGAEVADSPLYARLGYSTATSPILGSDGETDPRDMAVTLADAQGRPSHRSGFETLAVEVTADDAGALAGASRAQAHWVEPDPHGFDHGYGASGIVSRGAPLTTVSIVSGPWEVRLVRVDREPAAGEVQLGALTIGGWPLPDSSELASVVEPLVGLERAEPRVLLDATPLGDRTVIPAAATERPEVGSWYGAAVSLGDSASLNRRPDVELGAGTATVCWPGHHTTTVVLPE
ncbi:DUF2264 domain-containing protein [Arthrobacter sp. JZ12]|uniref:DUF2264 domain-containing protein n=1 Tax=Arthrobacter sp. JZ12 TaxID=2654190 RepID=UPI002B477145|nr:DUF2264 domain-containing protein [Arthrobacter sp. JZ12]WRH23899.1 DUF2264 domain-containing protein [Arthrobacter sp. JZ12]